MVISQRDSIEFVVNEIAFVRLKEKQKHVEFLFNVRITATGACEGELNWVKVNGDEKLRMRAKVCGALEACFLKMRIPLTFSYLSVSSRNT